MRPPYLSSLQGACVNYSFERNILLNSSDRGEDKEKKKPTNEKREEMGVLERRLTEGKKNGEIFRNKGERNREKKRKRIKKRKKMRSRVKKKEDRVNESEK